MAQNRTLRSSRPPRHQKPGDRRTPAYRKRNSHEVSSCPFTIEKPERRAEPSLHQLKYSSGVVGACDIPARGYTMRFPRHDGRFTGR